MNRESALVIALFGAGFGFGGMFQTAANIINTGPITIGPLPMIAGAGLGVLTVMLGYGIGRNS